MIGKILGLLMVTSVISWGASRFELKPETRGNGDAQKEMLIAQVSGTAAQELFAIGERAKLDKTTSESGVTYSGENFTIASKTIANTTGYTFVGIMDNRQVAGWLFDVENKFATLHLSRDLSETLYNVFGKARVRETTDGKITTRAAKYTSCDKREFKAGEPFYVCFVKDNI